MSKLRLKKVHLSPITSYLILIFVVLFLSFVLSLFDLQTTYNVINSNSFKLDQVTSVITNLLNFKGLKNIISSSVSNFMSYPALSNYLVAIIGLSVGISSGFFELLAKRVFGKVNNKYITFLIIFISTISSLINEVGFVILIPIAAIIYQVKNRNPLIGVYSVFAACAFGYGTTLFVGSTEVMMMPYTSAAARMVDKVFHVSLTSNLIIMIVTSVLLSIVGTCVVERLIVPKLSKYKDKKTITQDVEVIEDIDLEQEILSNEYKEKRGLKYVLYTAIVFLIIFIYSLIPNLPFSGLLLDNTQSIYLDQIFGVNSYFQDGFSFMISLLFLFCGIAYGIGSKKFKNDRELFSYSTDYISNNTGLIGLLFLSSILIYVFNESQIPNFISGVLSNMLSNFSFSGLGYFVIAFIFICISDIFLPDTTSKWLIFAPTIIPQLMKANIAPQFVQFMARAADSCSGISPFFAYFVFFVGYMNMYNGRSDKPISISECIKLLYPYFIIIIISWLLILIGWYIIGLPIGPGVFPTI